MADRNDPVLLVSRKENMAYLTLNRPHVLNCLNAELLTALRSELETLSHDTSVRGFFITGAGGKAFSAGADIGYLHSASPLQVRELAALAIEVNSMIENSGRPSIALINGYALGGGLELAEACTLRVAVPSAQMGHPEVRLGAVAGWGGTTRLPRLIGKGRAAELLLTGKSIQAEEALSYGLVNLVADSDRLPGEGERLMGEILENAPAALRLTWEALHRGLDVSLEESARIGADCFGLAASTDDFREGTAAFLKKRKASFKGT